MFNIFEDGFGVHYVASSLDLYPLKLAVFPILHQSHGSTFWMWLCSSNSIMGCTVSFIIMEKIHSSPEKKILWPIITVNACILGKISCQVLGKIIFFQCEYFQPTICFYLRLLILGALWCLFRQILGRVLCYTETEGHLLGAYCFQLYMHIFPVLFK